MSPILFKNVFKETAYAKNMIKTIIFDLGNVIVKVNWNTFYKKAVVKSNKSLQYIKKYCENPSKNIIDFELGKINSEEFYNKITNDLCLKMSFKDFKAAYCNIFPLNENVAGIIKKLKKNYRLVLLSNTDKLHFEFIKNKYKIVDIFDEYVLSYKEGCRKPNPLIFLKAIKKAKAMPFNCLYFDDIPEFVLAARMLGIKAFQYKNFEKLKNDLKKAGVLTKP